MPRGIRVGGPQTVTWQPIFVNAKMFERATRLRRVHLDLYTLRRRIGSLEGTKLWIVADDPELRPLERPDPAPQRVEVEMHATQARRALEHLRVHEDGLPGHGLRAADPDPARHRATGLRCQLHARWHRGGRRD